MDRPMEEMRATLAKALEGAVTDEIVERATKKVRDMTSSLLEDMEYGIRYDLTENLSHFVKEMAGRAVEALLAGNEDEMVRWLHCDNRGYTGRSDAAYTQRSIEEQHPVIHGKLFETGYVLLRKRVVEAHRDLIANQRILDLEDQVKSLVAQNNKLERERNELRERVRYEAA